jgi:hypothetical protein
LFALVLVSYEAMPILPQQAIPPRNPIRLLAPVQQREEAELLRLAIETFHPGATRYLSRGSLADKAKELAREAGYAGDSSTWYRAVARYLATLRSEHTTVEWSDRVRKHRAEKPTHFPFRITLLGKRALVTQATQESGIEVGDELLEIEGRRVDGTRRFIADWTSVEGHTNSAKGVKFGEGGLDEFGPILWGLRPIYKFKFRKAGEKPLTAIKFEDWKALRPDRTLKEAVTLTRLDGRIAVLRVDRFVPGAEPADPEEVFKPHFEVLQREGAARLILDLRGLDGASDEVPRTLLRYLAPQPVAWASTMWMKPVAIPEPLKPYLTFSDPKRLPEGTPSPDGTLALSTELTKPQEPLPERYEGPLDVLVGPRNAGATTIFLAHLRTQRPVRLIGEATGGSAEGGSGDPFWLLRLPASGFTVRIPAARLDTGLKGGPIQPDVRKSPTEDDVLGKSDTVLDWTVANPAEAPKPKKE